MKEIKNPKTSSRKSFLRILKILIFPLFLFSLLFVFPSDSPALIFIFFALIVYSAIFIFIKTCVWIFPSLKKVKKRKLFLYFFLLLSIPAVLGTIISIITYFEITPDVEILMFLLIVYVSITSVILFYRFIIIFMNFLTRVSEIKEMKVEIDRKKLKVSFN